jgi:hypothetical protein
VRRLAQHAIAGVGFSAVVVAAAVAGLSSPPAQEAAIAVPAPLTTYSAPAHPTPTSIALDLAADRAARTEQVSRSQERLKAAAAKLAAQRAKTLVRHEQAVAAQKAKLKAAAAKAKAAEAKAKAEAAAAAAAKARALANRGYEPGVTDPREMARQILKNKFNYGADQYSCFDYIIMRESGWRVNAANPSGAYGIPQAKPGSKMASVGSDWRTNPATQIIWGIQYMKSRYGSPCSARSFKASHGWY